MNPDRRILMLLCAFMALGENSCYRPDMLKSAVIPSPPKVTTKHAKAFNERAVFMEEAEKIDRRITEEGRKMRDQFWRQKLPMIQINSISPLALADIMEEKFQQPNAPRIRFLVADEEEIEELKVPRGFEEYRESMGAFFPDKNGEYTPMYLLMTILPHYSFFWQGKTLMISRFVGSD